MPEEKTKFENRLRAVHESDTLKEVLRIIDIASVFVTVYAVFYLLISLFFKDVSLGIRASLTLALPFLFVTLLRRMIKAPRPFELFAFYGDNIKHKAGRSFPSRHAFSAFATATLMLFYNFLFALLLFVLATSLSVARVLRGYHFPRDVIAGGIIGIITSLLGYFLLIL